MIQEDFFLAWDFLCSMVLRIASSQALCGNVAVVAPLGIFSSHLPKTSPRTWEYTDHCCSLLRKGCLSQTQRTSQSFLLSGLLLGPCFSDISDAPHQHCPYLSPTSATPTGQRRALSTWNPARSRQSPLLLGKSPASEETCYLTKTLLG